MEEKSVSPDVIAGVEAAGIPHSAALGFHLGLPSVFVRKQEKDHGTKKLVEGGDVIGKNVLLVEDLVTTGGSSLRAVAALRAAGAIVTDVFVIVTYGFPESIEAFKQAGVNLHALTSFPIILEEAISRGSLSEIDAQEVIAWTKDPHSWDNRI
jgi:orotate phosphoribosyltransferase